MKRPKTYEELLELVNPMDLDEILGFSGINDKPDTEHWKLRRKYIKLAYDSLYDNFLEDHSNWRNPYSFRIDDNFYDTLIRCIQDFYYWSHEFHHIYASIYKRVVKVLEIKTEEINKHVVEKNEAKISNLQ